MFGDDSTVSAQVETPQQAYTAQQVAAMTEPPGAATPTSPYTPDQQQVLVSQLNTYKGQLADLYSQRSDNISNFESLRFQHLTQWRFNLESTLTAIAGHIGREQGSNTASIFRNNFAIPLKLHIPLTTIDGGQGTPAPGYGTPIGWGAGNITLFSPAQALLDWYETMPGANYFSSTTQQGLLTTNVSDRTTYYFSANNSTNGVQSWTNPPSLAFLKACMNLDDNTALYVQGLLSKDYGYGSLLDLMTLGVAQNKNLVNLAYAMFNFQPQVDALEAQIRSFITQYQAAGMLSSTPDSSLMNQLQTIADNQNAAKVLAVATTPPSNTTPDLTTAPVQAVTASSSPNWLLYAGVFAVAVLIIKRKKS